MKKLIVLVIVLIFRFGKICFGQESTKADEIVIISWIQQNAGPISYVEAG